MSDGKKRIIYIDYLKGLTILWVVWYHTIHPAFVDFSFRIPLFFFVSGIFFRPYPFKEFVKKKINTLVIPFIFFYLIYYIWMIAMHALKYHTFSGFDYGCISGILDLHINADPFTVNPPLWFICALIILQFLLYGFAKFIKNNWLLFATAIAVSVFGVLFVYGQPTPFMLGRSLPYFVFYAAGFVIGRKLIDVAENRYGRRLPKYLTITSLALFTALAFGKTLVTMPEYAVLPVYYLEVFSVIIFSVFFFKYICRAPFLRPLLFYGKNSYIVLGMHEIVLTTLLIIWQNHIGMPDVWGGMTMMICTVIILAPVIWLLNRLCPALIGKNKLWK